MCGADEEGQGWVGGADEEGQEWVGGADEEGEEWVVHMRKERSGWVVQIRKKDRDVTQDLGPSYITTTTHRILPALHLLGLGSGLLEIFI